MGTAEMRDQRRAFIISIKIDEGRTGLLYATSPEMPGLLVAAEDRDSLLDEVPRVIKAMFQAKGLEVAVLPSSRAPGATSLESPPWVAIPAHLAALANSASGQPA